jgi:secondary thiamine-phosphate synthase enzyme
MIITKELTLQSNGILEVMNITEDVREFVKSTGVIEGKVNVFYRHTTGGVIIGEHEAGIVADLNDMFERIIPTRNEYLHHIRAVDFNGHAHIRSALLTISVEVPISGSDLLLGTYQEILAIDMQIDKNPRYVILQVWGE